MQASALTSREAVLQAIREYDRVGQAAFLAKYRFRRSHWYQLVYKRTDYDSKAIAGAALAYQYGASANVHEGLHGGVSGVVPVLRRLGFTVVDVRERAAGSPKKTPSSTNSPAAIAQMLLRGLHARLRYDGGGAAVHTIYADQRRVAEVWVGKSVVRLNLGERPADPPRGSPHLSGKSTRWPGGGTRVTRENIAESRALLLYAAGAEPQATARQKQREQRPQRSRARRARAFDPTRRPASYRAAANQVGLSPEEIAALHEKANAAHHAILVCLYDSLRRAGWRDIEEVERGTDLRATAPSGSRVIFEAKSLTDTNESRQVRGGLAQLLEYRYLEGRPSDKLCLATNRPVEHRRATFLQAVEIDCAWTSGGDAVHVQLRPLCRALAEL